MKITEDGLVIECTGKEIHATGNIVGIDPELTISQGYNGIVRDHKFTQEEREELADYVIDLWQKFKKKEGKNESPF